MTDKNEQAASKSARWKAVALFWILIECNLTGGTIFGFASLFSVLPRYQIYQSECGVSPTPISSNQTATSETNCPGQIKQYQLAFALGIAFFNIPAVLFGVFNDVFGARSLKLVAILFHLVSWLSLSFIKPGYDWLLRVHAVCLALAGICTVLVSLSIATHFGKRRGLITAIISGSQLASSIWYGIFQLLIERDLISLTSLAKIWASLSVVMFISAFLFFDFRSPSIQSKPTTDKATIASASENTLMHHLTSSLFIMVTLFLSFLLLSVSFLPVTWFPWLMHLTDNDLSLTNHYTFLYNMSAASGMIIAPISGLIVDYKISRGYQQKLLNISILQSLTWTFTVILCLVCMFPSTYAALTAMVIMLFSRVMLVAGSQAVIVTVFPARYIGSLIGAMWTVAGVISFVIYGLTLLADHPTNNWRGWAVILFLCLLMSGHLIQLWRLFAQSKRQSKSQPLPKTEEEIEILN